MKHKKNIGGNSSRATGLRTTLAMMMFVTLLWSCAAMRGKATPKDSLRLFRQSSSSSFVVAPEIRHKRGTSAEARADDSYYDENFEIIPVTQGDPPKTLGEQIAQSFANMWQSLADTVKHCVEGIRQLFASDEANYPQTPEQVEQMRAVMEARGKAIEEQNEIWRRSTNENQL